MFFYFNLVVSDEGLDDPEHGLGEVLLYLVVSDEGLDDPEHGLGEVLLYLVVSDEGLDDPEHGLGEVLLYLVVSDGLELDDSEYRAMLSTLLTVVDKGLEDSKSRSPKCYITL